jgi:hypothetical protein
MVSTSAGGEPHVSIEKVCKPVAINAGVQCRITITNDGTAPLTAPVAFGDQGQWSGSGTPMHVASTNPSAQDLTCTSLPDNLSCMLPGSELPAGSSQWVDVTISPEPGEVAYQNCATLGGDLPAEAAHAGRKSCVTGGGEIAVHKTGPAVCNFNQDCTFQITLGNSSDQAFMGSLTLVDAMYLNAASAGASIASISPPFGCDAEPATLPFGCTANVSLAGHEQQTHTVVVHMPSAPVEAGSAALEGENCFGAVGSIVALATARGQAKSRANVGKPSGDGQGYSCTSFTLRPVPTVTALPCPGDEVFLQHQCQCPPGTRAAGSYHCKRSTTSGGGPVSSGTPVCDDPVRRLRAGSCCPFGLVANGMECLPPKVRIGCAAGEAGTPPHCCPADRPIWNGQRCETPSGGVSIPQSTCTFPLVGDYPDCHCPDGAYRTDSGQCTPRKAPVKACALPLVGDCPDCHCPAGQVFDRAHSACRQPASQTCLPPRSLVNDGCVCPATLVWNGKTCGRPIIYVPHGVPAPQPGTATLAPACRAPATGVYPNCTCPDGTSPRNGVCVTPPCPPTQTLVHGRCTRLPRPR